MVVMARFKDSRIMGMVAVPNLAYNCINMIGHCKTSEATVCQLPNLQREAINYKRIVM